MSGGGVDPSIDRGGWVSLEYGESGNVLSMTVRGQCHDTMQLCDDPGGTNPDARDAALAADCACDVEHHYQYRWDELNRLAEGRRYDRGTGLTDWELQVRQTYRYDGANVRMVKETRDQMSSSGDGTDGVARAALYVYPGDFERRGLQVGGVGDEWVEGAIPVETQYLIAGSRLVWKEGATPGSGGTGFENEARLTYAVTNLIQSTSAVIDLFSGQLLERGTYYPNGARETLRTERGEGFSLEPMGFTGKEGDDEVGLVYFGERYLMPHLGRWASADPLQVHAGGGGEFGNSYHYVSGNLLQARDPLGLQGESLESEDGDDGAGSDTETTDIGTEGEETADAEEAGAQLYVIRLRVDVPGSDDATEPSDHEDAVDGMDTGHVFLVFEGPDGAMEGVGSYPRNSNVHPNRYVRGVPAELRDDTDRPYEYEVVYEVTQEQFEAAKEKAFEQPASWGVGSFCTDHAADALDAAGISTPRTSTEYRPPISGSLTWSGNFPGRLARELHTQGTGRYVEDGQSDPSVGKSGSCSAGGTATDGPPWLAFTMFLLVGLGRRRRV